MLSRIAATSRGVARARLTLSHMAVRSVSSSASVSPIARAIKDATLFREQCFVDGQWVSAASGESTPVRSPTTGATIGTIPALTGSEVTRAIAAAQAALPKWSALTAKARADILNKWYDLVMANKQDLGTILTMEQGKPMSEAIGEVAYGAGFFQVYASEAERVHGEVLQPSNSNTRVLTFRQPVGVVGAITPWNFPTAMITRKCGAALAAGCTVVLKPSEFTPYSAFALAELATRAGVPAGVFNLVTGPAAEVGEALTSSPDVKKITFTGSTRVGKLLLKQCADTVKRTSMELGGNAPYIVFDDADIDAAIGGLLLCKFRNTGQTCVTANRIFVQAGIYDEFARRLAARVQSELKQGSGLEPSVNLGPLINAAAVTKVQSQVDDAVAKGGKIITGGRAAEQSQLIGEVDSQLFFQPTVITGATQEMAVAHEETFGPVAFLFKVRTQQRT